MRDNRTEEEWDTNPGGLHEEGIHSTAGMPLHPKRQTSHNLAKMPNNYLNC